jgi:outer membrane protein OmpA-like peptidoglycan-associated protein
MQKILLKRVLIFVIALFSMGLMVGCSGMEKRPKDRPGYLYYHKPLPEASRALDEARMAGKDKECPAEYNAAKDMVDKAYEIYFACDTKGAIAMAQGAIDKIKALCPSKPLAVLKPEPKPEPKPELKLEVKPKPMVNIEANPGTIEKGDSSDLSWTSKDATTLSLDQGIGDVPAIGSRKVSPAKTTTYTITAKNEGGVATDSATLTVGEIKIILEDIHFDFDKATLTKVAAAILDSNIKTLKANSGINVQIEGHTCAHGAENYNMALGERRANAVREYLANHDIIAGRMTTISYGETRLAMPETPIQENKESNEAKANRRIHFEVFVK